MATAEVATPVEAPDPKQTAISEYGRLMLQHKVRIEALIARTQPRASIGAASPSPPVRLRSASGFFRARKKI